MFTNSRPSDLRLPPPSLTRSGPQLWWACWRRRRCGGSVDPGAWWRPSQSAGWAHTGDWWSGRCCQRVLRRYSERLLPAEDDGIQSQSHVHKGRGGLEMYVWLKKSQSTVFILTWTTGIQVWGRKWRNAALRAESLWLTLQCHLMTKHCSMLFSLYNTCVFWVILALLLLLCQIFLHFSFRFFILILMEGRMMLHCFVSFRKCFIKSKIQQESVKTTPLNLIPPAKNVALSTLQKLKPRKYLSYF